MATGRFTDEMKLKFNAHDGAYTTFTEEEVRKTTFNVKAAIRNILEQYIGRDNLPRVNVTEKQSIEFIVCKESKGDIKGKLDIQCKYSKPNSYEMSIYFRTYHVEQLQIEPGDYWFVYFKNDDIHPYIGVISKVVWEKWFPTAGSDQTTQQNEVDAEIHYQTPVEGMKIIETDAPDAQSRSTGKSESTVKSLTPDQSAMKAKNRKRIGNRGEEIAIEIEKRRLKHLGREDLVERIIPVGQERDGLGYDVQSVDIVGDNKTHDIYIEVKTTEGGIDTPFNISKNELEVSRRLKEYYYLYRIFNLKQNSGEVNFYKVKGALDENYDLEATDFRAYKKN